MSPTFEWQYDATSSRPLWLIAHGFVAGLGGPLILVAGVLLISLPEILPQLGTETILLVTLLFLVGGPFSLLYLWPMIRDPAQRPEITAFVGEHGSSPWTKRSVPAAALAGALVLGGLVAIGVPFAIVYGSVVLAIFSPVIVSVFTTIGSIEDDCLTCNGATVPLRQVTGVRSIRIGATAVWWVSYARGTGLLTPRLLTVPATTAADVRTAFEHGGEPQQADSSWPSRPVRVILGAMALLFLGVGIVAVRAIDEPTIRIYVGGVTGAIGVLLSVAAWRGV